MENTKENPKSSYLGKEKIWKLLLKFSIPCVASLLISSLYNIVDQIFVGNSSLSTLGSAATGIVFPVLIVTQAFAWCFGDGCGAFLSICQGRKDTEKAHKAIGTGLVLTVIFSIILLVICLIWTEPVLKLFGASDDFIDLASTYLRILAPFFTFYMIQNMLASVIRSDGSPVYSMIATGSGAILNIILDPIFIFGLNMGIAGAAWATVIGLLLSFGLSIAYLFRSKTFKLKLRSFIPDFKVFKSALKLGVSSFITQASIVVLSACINAMVKYYGGLSKFGEANAINAVAVETKVFTILINIVVGIVLGGQPIIGYNMGSGQTDRVKKTYKTVLFSILVVTGLFTIVNLSYPKAYIALFGGMDNLLYVEFAEIFFKMFLGTVMFTSFIKMSSIFFQAVGKPVYSTLASLSRDFFLFIPLIFILPIFFENNKAGDGIYGTMWAPIISDFIAGAFIITLNIIYFKNFNKNKPLDQDHVDIEKASTVIKASKPGIIYTIAREHGSQGKGIGELIAKKLNIPFYSKEVIAIAAKESGLAPDFIEHTTEATQLSLQQLIVTKDASVEALEAQKRVVEEIASKGSCVIVGRGADYILKDNPNVRRIFIFADEELKIKNVMEMYGDSRQEAIKNIKHSDSTRASYYKSISSSTWGLAHNYDLCISSREGKEKTAEAIINIFNK